MEKERIVLTGATGLLGSAIRRSLLDFDVCLLSRNKIENLQNNETQIIGNFSDESVADFLAQKGNCFIHAASLVGPRSSFQEEIIQFDIVGTIHLIKTFYQHNPTGHFLYLSTAGGLYDLNAFDVKTEESDIIPKSLYGAVKCLIESQLEKLVPKDGLATVLRPSAIYGDCFKKNQSSGLVDKLLKTTVPIYSKEVVEIFDRLQSARDYLFFEDVAEAVLRSIHRKSLNCFDIYNLGTGQEVSIEKVIEMINSVSKNKVNVTIQKVESERTSLIVNSDKAQRDFNWVAKHSLETGIIKMLQNMNMGEDK